MGLYSSLHQLNGSDSSAEIKIQKNIIVYNNHPAKETEPEKLCRIRKSRNIFEPLKSELDKISNGEEIYSHLSSLEIRSNNDFSTIDNLTQNNGFNGENI